MPGTLGSIAACVIGVIYPIHWIVIIAVTILGTYCSDCYAKKIGVKDPQEVVIDEVVGMWISMYALSVSYAIPAFVLFRIVDIFKPFPVNKFEELPGGFGIMADDIVGGFIVRLMFFGIQTYFLGLM